MGGKGFEDAFISWLERNGFAITRATGIQDRLEGTDFFLNFEGKEVRFDVTRNSKMGVISLGSVEFIHSMVYIELRFGNEHCRFEEPVIVLHIDVLPHIDEHMAVRDIKSTRLFIKAIAMRDAWLDKKEEEVL